ncbi:MAG: cupin domain-containing protein [Thermoplasmata archaeon]
MRLLRGAEVTVKLASQDTKGAVTVIEHLSEPGGFAGPPHLHHAEDEISYVLEGEVTVQVGGQQLRATAGSIVVKPREVPHTFWNSGKSKARVLEIVSPAGIESYFEEIAAVMEAGPPEMGRILEIARKHKLEFPGTKEYFEELAPLMSGPEPPNPADVIELARKHGVV